VDIVVKGRRTDVSERFRQHVTEKLAKIGKLDGKLISLDVEVSKERNPRLANRCERVEITCRSRGPVIRAEAAADDPYAALDLAYAKLAARMRKSADRRRVHHGSRTPRSVAAATASPISGNGSSGTAASAGSGEVEAVPEVNVPGYEEGPFVVREKTHHAKPMTLDQALYEMELVGHDFYLFVELESGRPSVVYRRRGYDYGVIRLEV
jgi:ribosomal subunit interface protein